MVLKLLNKKFQTCRMLNSQTKSNYLFLNAWMLFHSYFLYYGLWWNF